MGKYLAWGLSFLLVGLGQLYNGQTLKGVIIFATAGILGVFLGVFGIFPIWFYGMYDAYMVALEKSESSNGKLKIIVGRGQKTTKCPSCDFNLDVSNQSEGICPQCKKDIEIIYQG